MRLELLLSALALCGVLFSSSDGTPIDEDVPDGTPIDENVPDGTPIDENVSDEIRTDEHINLVQNQITIPESSSYLKCRYSLEEELLILEVLGSTSGRITWPIWEEIAKAHKERLQSKREGYYQRRSATGLYNRFTRFIMKDKGLVKVPEFIKAKCSVPRYKYTRQERKFINDKILSYTGISLKNIQFWKDIAREHDSRREAGAPGFQHRRRARSLLRNTFYNMKSRGLISKAVEKKYPQYFGNPRGDSSKRPSRAMQQAERSLETVEPHEDNWADPLLEALEHLSEENTDDSERENDADHVRV